MAQLLYGSGLQLTACRRLCFKESDYARHQFMVRDGKDMHDYVTLQPPSMLESLRAHAEAVRTLHTSDRAQGYRTKRAGSIISQKEHFSDRYQR